MKNLVTLAFIVLFFAGCGGGSPKEEQGFKGVTKKKDYIAEGFKFLQQKDVVRGIRSFDMAIKQDPQNVENYLVLGQVYLRLQNVDRAVDTFQAAIRVAPENGEAHYLLATSEALRGQKDKAIESAQKSAEIFMQNRDAEKFKLSAALLRSLSLAEQPQTQEQNGVASTQQ